MVSKVASDASRLCSDSGDVGILMVMITTFIFNRVPGIGHSGETADICASSAPLVPLPLCLLPHLPPQGLHCFSLGGSKAHIFALAVVVAVYLPSVNYTGQDCSVPVIL